MRIKGPIAVSDWYNVGAHGHIGVCDSRQLSDVVYVDDHVSFVDHRGVWRVVGIEVANRNGRISPWIRGWSSLVRAGDV